MKQANVYVGHRLDGILTEDDGGYEFRYLPEYLASENAEAISGPSSDTSALSYII